MKGENAYVDGCGFLADGLVIVLRPNIKLRTTRTNQQQLFHRNYSLQCVNRKECVTPDPRSVMNDL